MPDFPEPGSVVENAANYGPAGPNGEAPHMTMAEFQQWQKDQLAANAAATPAPPGFENYAQWAATVNAQLAEIKLQNETIIAMLEARQ